MRFLFIIWCYFIICIPNYIVISIVSILYHIMLYYITVSINRKLMDHTKNRIHLFYWRPRRNGASLGFKRCCFRMLRPHLFPERPSSLSRLLAPASTVPVVEAARAGAPSFIAWELHIFLNVFCGETTIETVLCRKPSCDFVNFHDWPSWQKVTMTRPTTWRFGRLMPWRHARIVAEQGAAAVFSMFHIPNYIQKQLLQY